MPAARHLCMVMARTCRKRTNIAWRSKALLHDPEKDVLVGVGLAAPREVLADGGCTAEKHTDLGGLAFGRLPLVNALHVLEQRFPLWPAVPHKRVAHLVGPALLGFLQHFLHVVALCLRVLHPRHQLCLGVRPLRSSLISVELDLLGVARRAFRLGVLSVRSPSNEEVHLHESVWLGGRRHTGRRLPVLPRVDLGGYLDVRELLHEPLESRHLRGRAQPHEVHAVWPCSRVLPPAELQ
mmetsp:Transcript_55900/g.145371  ORF Transcript_55900/g.145371 Transcript_55900/m.145371 type:complete len:238 (+) Transcript_55900:471-1184(+)